MNKCIVPGCSTFQDIMFSLPQTEVVLRQWLINIHRIDLLAKNFIARKYYKICFKHFEANCFQNELRIKLNRGAIPTLLLPGNFIDCTLNQQHASPSPAITIFQNPEHIPTPNNNQQDPIFESVPTPSPTPNNNLQDPIFESVPIQETSQYQHPISRRKHIIRQSKNNGKLLKLIGETRIENLSAREKKLYFEAKKYKQLIAILKKRKSVKQLIPANSIINNPILKNLEKLDNAPPVIKLFIMSQLRLYGKKCHGRRYTPEEKSFFLTILKHSPRGYHYLSKLFAMPSTRLLKKSLSNVILNVGLNDKIISYLNKCSERKTGINKYCILIFDEVALHGNLSYNKGMDFIEGLEEVGQEGSYKVADHALVFMLRGLAKQWKQPLAFLFAQSATNRWALKSCIKKITQAIHEKTKFKIVASVSDLGSNNRSAIRELSEESGYGDRYIYKINNSIIFHIFDAPHLLKCTRNNLLDKHILYNNQIAKWSDILDAYKLDGLHADGRLTKLTRDHIQPDGKKRMKVRLAAQVFSRTTYAFLTQMTRTGDMNATGTAEICLFINNLFDSMNSIYNSSRPLGGKYNENSGHNTFWSEAKIKLYNFKFFKNGKPVPTPPCIRHWIISIRNVQDLWKSLKDLGFKFLLTRSLNQDPLENFFSVIRGLCGANRNPTCYQFISAFKTAIINNTLRNTTDSNCEEDQTEYLLSLNSFLENSSSPNSDFPTRNFSTPLFSTSIQPTSSENIHRLVDSMQNQTSSYIAGFIARKLIKNDCESCIKFFTSDICTDNHVKRLLYRR